LEARAFYALAFIATADISDPAFLQQQQAGRIAESVLAQNPDHPGAHHYVIHAYDLPGLAQKALSVANNYGEITPKVPHAAHMMTHIYTRLGLWEKAITWNSISAETAWALCVEQGEINLHYTHALDYLAYAHLQVGNDAEALDILQTADQLKPPYSETNRHASAYAFAAIPARYAVERRDWEAAIALTPKTPSTFPWVKAHDPYVAITHFARAIGFSRLGRPEDATADIEMLRKLKASISASSTYWAAQVEIQEASALAWQTYARGETQDGLGIMKNAATLEAATQKHALTPGAILPASEMYADMLLEMGNYGEALAAYKVSLTRSPKRLNGLYGAGKAAAAANNIGEARRYFSQLVMLAQKNKAHRSTIAEARAYLQDHPLES
jgi:tetratricopeptide (TPR) repeat protein